MVTNDFQQSLTVAPSILTNENMPLTLASTVLGI